MPKNNSYSDSQIETTRIPTDQLLLDNLNPRIRSLTSEGQLGQEELVKLLWREMAVDEIALSIIANGYFPGEPLFVIQEAGQRKFTVIEGNRRLAAVKIILDERLRNEIRATELNPRITPELIQSLQDLPVIILESREDQWEYLGFRHINGPKPWDAFSKAQYVAHIHNDYNIPLDEIARRIGDRHSTVQRLYRGYEVLKQAEDEADFDKENRIKNRFHFSHLYTALDQKQFQTFLGLDRDDSLRPTPVPKKNLPALKELMIWLYGDKDKGLQPIIRKQNPDLNILREVISKNDALTVFRNLAAQGSPFALPRGHEVAIGDVTRFSDSLINAKDNLQQANATVSTGYDGDDELYEIIEDIYKTVQTLRRTMKRVYDGRKKGG